MKAERTYKELQKFDNVATQYLIKNGYYEIGENGRGKFTEKEITKLSANIKNILKQIGQHFVEFNEKVEELKIDNCSVDEKTKIILRDPDKSYQFTKEGLKSFNKSFRDLENTKAVIHERIADGNWELTDEEKEVFSGLVIPEIKELKDGETKE